MLGAVRLLARTLVAFAETRARLAANELEEQALRFLEIALWSLLGLFLLGLAVLMGALVIVLVFWDSHRVLAAGLVTAGFALAGLFGVLMARLRLRQRPALLAATLAELAKDRERIERQPQAEEPHA